MREKAALYLLVVAVIMIVGIDITPYVYGDSHRGLSYLESAVDAAAVVLIYILMRRELNFRTKVLHMAAHDLRNPLGVIRGYTEVILEKSVSPETEREMLHKIHAKSDEIMQMLNDLLDASVIERQQLKMDNQNICLVELLNEVRGDFSEVVARKRQSIRMEIEDDPRVFADPARLRQVLVNLMSNAVKYSPAGSEILWAAAVKDGRARVSVQDRGPGLSRDEKTMIFDSFTRVKKPTTGGETSTGLGLSISKSLVELSGGKIWAESDGVGQGSKFVVEFPAALS